MRLLLLMILSLLVACGGGGGGGSGGSGSSSASDPEGIRILHGSVDSFPVEVAIDGGIVTGTAARFAVPVGYKSIGGGQKTVAVVPKGNAAGTLFSFANEFDSSLGYSVLLFGTRESGLSAALITDAAPSLAAGEVAIKIANGISNASSVTVIINGVTVPAVARGAASDYIVLPTTSLQISAISSSGQQIASTVATVNANSANTLLIAGEIGYFVKAVVY